ncbi:hypothetical protein FisN_9Hh357 [Fistulifera solaris]|uniref:Helicase-associated domain-containing protein n=1 Tax=Fistulifera solaris TaxID=1519565 RepID=A0A1Z5KD87_FISSO|nr:hypothetical protein FisN_9Hh357 [Fistulifera solaris]|eukprot:GAX24105.1 hypothetical protein FisN_9Hh357 [Fistulifera solaris]
MIRVIRIDLTGFVLFLLCVPLFSWTLQHQHSFPKQRLFLPRPSILHSSAVSARSWRTRLNQSNGNTNNNADNDEAEWKAIFAAFRLYKAAFGDLKVPQRFVVPNIKPWPEAAHELKLGKVVAEIRATGKYLTPERRKALEQLGFVWQIRSNKSEPQQVSWQQVKLAYQTYQKLNNKNSEGIVEIPNTFTVPAQDPWPQEVHGMPLGRFWPVVRDTVIPQNAAAQRAFAEAGFRKQDAENDTADMKVDDGNYNEEAREKPTESSAAPKQPYLKSPAKTDSNIYNGVNELDAQGSANDVRFQNVYLALQTYKSIHGDLLVPQPFAVPKNDRRWPEATWGLRLGARVNAIRSQGTFVNNYPSRRKMLDELGFAWTPPVRGTRRRASQWGEEDEEDAGFKALLEGSFDAGDGLYSEGDDSAASGWNFDGARMSETSSGMASGADMLSSTSSSSVEEEYVEERTLDESLKEATERALEVNVIEGLTPNKRVIKGKQTKDIPWFNDDFGDDFVFEDVVEALTVYKAMYGNLTFAPTKNEKDDDVYFVVPTPKEVTGFLDLDDDDDDDYEDGIDAFDQFDLDARAAAAIASFGDDDRGARNSLFRDNSGEDIIAAEIRRLEQQVEEEQEIVNARARVATVAAPKVLKTIDRWPEHLGGMQLGSIVRRIRDGSLEVKHIPGRKAQLDALGFDWGDDKYFLDVPFEKAMCAMYAYYMIRGDLFVYEDFVMPDEDPWPEALAGYELGQAVKRLRELQNFLEAYHPEKVSLLRMIDFMWFSETMALPLDPNERAMTSETLLLSAFGHPDYAKMVDIPMGLPDKIIADGPFTETNDDPKLWWRPYHNWDYVKDYWYQQGRRDNAYALRKMGYPQMADEHEAKYGPGLFSKISATMQDLTDNGIEGRPVEEKQELLKTLSFYRQEMYLCTDIHPQDRDQMLLDFETQMLKIMEDKSVVVPTDETDNNDYASSEYEDEYADDYEDEVPEDDGDEEFDDDDVEFDMDDELGFGEQ